MGSALAVLLFLFVLLIAFIFVKAFKVDLAGGRS
jgi:multiple sugar transport system permease protein